MNITERAESAMEAVAVWREMVWRDFGARDVPPSMGWLVNGADAFDHAPPSVLHDLYQQAGDDTASVVYSVLRHLVDTKEDFPGFKEIVLVLDSYGAEGDYKDGPPPTNLEEDFMTNPNTIVTEQVTVIVVADDLVGGAEAAVALKPYRISDGGEMKFGETKLYGPDDVNAVDGAIISAMKWGVTRADA